MKDTATIDWRMKQSTEQQFDKTMVPVVLAGTTVPVEIWLIQRLDDGTTSILDRLRSALTVYL
jgi:hypothetical protein